MTLSERYEKFLEDALDDLKSGCRTEQELRIAIRTACDGLIREQGSDTAININVDLGDALSRKIAEAKAHGLTEEEAFRAFATQDRADRD
jgi:hypothetical protein